MAKRELEEIEVDISKPQPLSKKQKRLVKKGKIDAQDTLKPETKGTSQEGTVQTDRSKYGVWIGNLPFSAKEKELKEFLLAIASAKDAGKGLSEDAISRIKLVAAKGFAYVDVQTEEQMNVLIGLSESQLGGRNVLIKDARSFEGRPSKADKESKNPPSRILFVGNLSFDTTDEELELFFQHCGEIQRIRTATFQDTGKCKGFTFIDFKEVEAASNALADKRCRKLNGRILRMEYGEDRSKRRPRAENGAGAIEESHPETTDTRPAPANTREEPQEKPREYRKKPVKPARVGRSRPTPAQALATAQRGKQSVVPSTGKKITFD